jgi:hypothetical protein
MNGFITGGGGDEHFDVVTPAGVRRVVVGSAVAPCSVCGTSNADCLFGVGERGSFCCDDCLDRNTHENAPTAPEV